MKEGDSEWLREGASSGNVVWVPGSHCAWSQAEEPPDVSFVGKCIPFLFTFISGFLQLKRFHNKPTKYHLGSKWCVSMRFFLSFKGSYSGFWGGLATQSPPWWLKYALQCFLIDLHKSSGRRGNMLFLVSILDFRTLIGNCVKAQCGSKATFSFSTSFFPWSPVALGVKVHSSARRRRPLGVWLQPTTVRASCCTRTRPLFSHHSNRSAIPSRGHASPTSVLPSRT